MKKLILLTALALSVSSADAFEADLDGVVFKIDTIYSHVVGPGVTQDKLVLNDGNGRAMYAYCSSISRSKGAKEGLVEPRVILGTDTCRIGERVSSMAARHTGGDQQLLTGINGDYFIMSSFANIHPLGTAILGYPNMSCVIDRKVAAPDMIDIVSRENALITTNDNWYVDATDMSYTIISESNEISIAAKAINYPRQSGEIMLYNSYMGTQTSTTGGKELVLRIAEGEEWSMNKNIKFIVEGTWVEGGNSAIPSDGLVISCGPSYDMTQVEELVKSGIVYINLGLKLPAHNDIRPDIVNVIGGDVRILNQGEITREAIRWINPPATRYARSLVGFSQDRDMMIFAAVDGTGLNYYESAAFMRSLGCYDALMLDGGGSTAIWSDAFGIYNTPRDGAERAVGNGLFFALNTPKDDVVASIGFADYTVKLPKYGLYTPVIYGYNQYGQLVDTNVTGFTLEASDALGDVEGQSLLVTGEGMHALTVHKDGMSANVAVLVDNSASVELRHSSLLIDNYHPVAIEMFSKIDKNEMPVYAKAFSWVSENENIATVDANGVITGLANGTTNIVGTLGEQTLTIAVTVECPTNHYYNIIGNDASAWKGSGSGLSVSALTINDDGSLGVDFKITNTRGPKITLRNDTTIWSRPDAIEVVINPKDISISGITVQLEPFGVKAITHKIEEIEANKDNVLLFNVSDFTDPNDPGIYPLSFNNIVLNIPMAKGEYHLDIKSIKAVYNSYEAGVSDITLDTNIALRPSISDGQITLSSIADHIAVYDIAGRLVATVNDAKSITSPGPGVYIITARVGGSTQSNKIVIK